MNIETILKKEPKLAGRSADTTFEQDRISKESTERLQKAAGTMGGKNGPRELIRDDGDSFPGRGVWKFMRSD